MDLRDLVRALATHDALTAREWVADASRIPMVWSDVPDPQGLDPTARAIAAGVVELLNRVRSAAPTPHLEGWTAAKRRFQPSD